MIPTSKELSFDLTYTIRPIKGQLKNDVAFISISHSGRSTDLFGLIPKPNEMVLLDSQGLPYSAERIANFKKAMEAQDIETISRRSMPGLIAELDKISLKNSVSNIVAVFDINLGQPDQVYINKEMIEYFVKTEKTSKMILYSGNKDAVNLGRLSYEKASDIVVSDTSLAGNLFYMAFKDLCASHKITAKGRHQEQIPPNTFASLDNEEKEHAGIDSNQTRAFRSKTMKELNLAKHPRFFQGKKTEPPNKRNTNLNTTNTDNLTTGATEQQITPRNLKGH